MLHQFIPHDHHVGGDLPICEQQTSELNSFWDWIKECLHQDLGEGHLEYFMAKELPGCASDFDINLAFIHLSFVHNTPADTLLRNFQAHLHLLDDSLTSCNVVIPIPLDRGPPAFSS